MSAATFSAFRFDGRTAHATAVSMRLDDDVLIVEDANGVVLEREPLPAARVSDAFDHAPRLIALSSGTTLEVPDEGGELARVLERAGFKDSPATRLQRHWAVVMLALVACIGLIAAAYFFGLPVAARWVAFALPATVEKRLGTQLLAVLDGHFVLPSVLEETERATIVRRFGEAARKAAPDVTFRLEFRAAPMVNAFALPGGVIVVTDALVDVAGDDDAVIGVLAHELGHVRAKHGMRQVLQSAGAGSLAGLMWGDFSGTAASIPVLLGFLRSSRAFEREADEFAMAFLHENGLSVQPLQRFFASLTPGWLGVSTEPVTPDIVKGLGNREARGARIIVVASGGPAAKSGVQIGDVVTEFGGRKIDSHGEFLRAVRRTKTGVEVRIKGWRESSGPGPAWTEYETTVRLAERRTAMSDLPDFLSTHPPTAERLRRLGRETEKDTR